MHERSAAGSGLLLGAAAALLGVLLAPSPALSAGEVVAVRAPVLALYGSSDGGKIDELSRDQVPVPLDVEEVSDNRRLRVLIGGASYWIMPHQVRMADGVTVESGCISVSESYASTRGLGSC